MLNAYRQQEIVVRQKGIGEIARGHDIQQAGEEERAKHDRVTEAALNTQRDIQQQNADTQSYRASLDATRTGIAGSKLEKEYAPIGRDVIASFRGTNVEKLIPLLPPDVVAAMPRKDADAYAKDVTSSYSRLAKSPAAKPPRYIPMGDGKIHKLVDMPDGSTKDTIIGPAVLKGASRAASVAAEIKAGDATPGAATGPDTGAASAAAATPAAVPSPTTDTTNATPTTPPPAAAPKMGKRLGPVDSTKYKNGVYRDPKTRKRVIIKDGVAYDEAA